VYWPGHCTGQFFFMDKNYLKKYSNIIGCDEVGRGPIAGPVNACAVKIIDSKTVTALLALNVTDSKKLSLKKRKHIKLGQKYKVEIGDIQFEYCVTEHTHAEIDQINILQASLSAMKIASDKLLNKQLVDDSIVLIDGNKLFKSKATAEAIVKGDSKLVCIGMASIIAKVFRDEKMFSYDEQYPGYKLAKNAGYPTKEHRDAVKKLGPCKIHRKSFKGVKEFL